MWDSLVELFQILFEFFRFHVEASNVAAGFFPTVITLTLILFTSIAFIVFVYKLGKAAVSIVATVIGGFLHL